MLTDRCDPDHGWRGAHEPRHHLTDTNDQRTSTMAWDFSTDPEFQEKLDWIDEFVREEVEPLDLAFSSHLVYDRSHPIHREVIPKLQDEVKKRDLWACHLG